MFALFWMAILSPLAGEIEHQVERLKGAKERTFAQTQEEFVLVSADQHYDAIQLPESY